MILRRTVSRLIAVMFLYGVVCGLGGLPARADLPRPPKPAPDSSEPQLLITTSSDGTAHLRIPKSMLNSLANQATPARSDLGISPQHTVVAGISLSAALAAGGLLFARRRGGNGRLLLLIAGIGGAGLIASFAMADVPPLPRPIPQSIQGVTMPVVIEVVEDGQIQLTIPTGKARLLAQHPTTRPS